MGPAATLLSKPSNRSHFSPERLGALFGYSVELVHSAGSELQDLLKEDTYTARQSGELSKETPNVNSKNNNVTFKAHIRTLLTLPSFLLINNVKNNSLLMLL